MLKILIMTLLLGACAAAPTLPEPVTPAPTAQQEAPPPPVKPLAVPSRPPKVALVLGGGAVRGFAHVGVIKVFEAQGIVPDLVVGTSAGSVVGALYAAGYSGFELQKIAFKLEEDSVGDWILPSRGFIKGEALQSYINKAVRGLPIERLKKPFAAVATDLQSGDMVVFQRGNVGQAVRASSSVPGVFQPVSINGRDYVDGGLTSPLPIRGGSELGGGRGDCRGHCLPPQRGQTRWADGYHAADLWHHGPEPAQQRTAGGRCADPAQYRGLRFGRFHQET